MDFHTRQANKVTACEQTIGYEFSNKTLCAEALNAAADEMAYYRRGSTICKLPKNHALAVYGDSTATEHLCCLWLDTGLERVLWTVIRNEVLGNENLAERGFGHGLDKFVTTNHGMDKVSPKQMATAMEAVLGAVRLDGGHCALAAVMERLGLTHPFLDLKNAKTSHYS